MSDEKQPAKRFYKAASYCAAEDGSGYSVTLDGRVIKTPAKAPLILPTEALAEAVAGEWEAQKEAINPSTMGMMQLISTAIDRVIPQQEAVVVEVAKFGGSDHLCYLAEHPTELVERQKQQWLPLLGWAEKTYGAKLNVTSGIMFVAQPEESLQAINKAVSALDAFELTVAHTITAGLGSVILALAVLAGEIDAETAFNRSRLDEEHEIEQWGEDEEAAKFAQALKEDMLDAERFFSLYRSA
ncbi:MAG: ATPase [Alphaproteobacteria bacterium]|nr:ATPase [Rhodospirillales bacterium]MCW9045953.1 ATPase [Alphaproteobacteria bacterium]